MGFARSQYFHRSHEYRISAVLAHEVIVRHPKNEPKQGGEPNSCMVSKRQIGVQNPLFHWAKRACLESLLSWGEHLAFLPPGCDTAWASCGLQGLTKSNPGTVKSIPGIPTCGPVVPDEFLHPCK